MLLHKYTLYPIMLAFNIMNKYGPDVNISPIDLLPKHKRVMIGLLSRIHLFSVDELHNPVYFI